MVDWSTVPYPAWWHARAAKRRVVLDAAVERLRSALATMPEIVGALVFGSYATNKVGPESDLDVMLVTTEPDGGDWAGRTGRIAVKLALGIPCDLLVYEPDEFERLRRERSFVAQACREGIWIATPPARPSA